MQILRTRSNDPGRRRRLATLRRWARRAASSVESGCFPEWQRDGPAGHVIDLHARPTTADDIRATLVINDSFP